MTASPRFWNMLARRYSRQPIADQAAYETKLEKSREYFTPECEVFEFGCGTGSTAILHAPHVGHIRAIDFSPKMIAIAQERKAAAGVRNVDFEVASIDDVQADDRFDVVMGMSILHLLNNRTEVIAKVFDLLKPGGAFLSSTVCIGGRHFWLQLLVPIGVPLGLLPTVNFFTAEELRDEMEEAGFVIEHQWRPKEDAAVFMVARKPA